MEFTDCFTWSDLDKGHKLKLISGKLLEGLPGLSATFNVGDVFEVVNIFSDEEGNHTVLKAKGLEFVIKRYMVYYFHWKY